MNLSGETYSAVELTEDLRAVVLDQRKLPAVEHYVTFDTAEGVAASIRDMLVRGAPAIGVAAAYGIAVAARAAGDDFRDVMPAADAVLRAARPTAVNLAWALDRMKQVVDEVARLAPAERAARLAAEARAIHREDVASCRAIGRHAVSLVPDKATILTHCNAGALATGGYGTALGVVRAAREAGKDVRVLACETRPYLQGARLTAWELAKSGIAVEVITDSMTGHFMQKGGIDLVVVGADRIARNGDVANKIGTYGVACIAHTHGIPFYVAAPWSTVDLACPDGDAIPIEQRPARELAFIGETRIVPEGVGVRNPSFDVTPARLVTRIVTERGVTPPDALGGAG